MTIRKILKTFVVIIVRYRLQVLRKMAFDNFFHRNKKKFKLIIIHKRKQAQISVEVKQAP